VRTICTPDGHCSCTDAVATCGNAVSRATTVAVSTSTSGGWPERPEAAMTDERSRLGAPTTVMCSAEKKGEWSIPTAPAPTLTSTSPPIR
jgi:hypothetical protein